MTCSSFHAVLGSFVTWRDFKRLANFVRSAKVCYCCSIWRQWLSLWFPFLPAYRGDEIHSRLLSLNGWMSKWCPQNNIGFIDNWTSFWDRPDLLKRDGLHPSWGGAALLSRNMAHSLGVRTWLTGAQVRKQSTDPVRIQIRWWIST